MTNLKERFCRPAPAPAPSPAPDEQRCPLTAAQEQLVLAAQIAAEASVAYNESIALELAGLTVRLWPGT